MTFGCQQWRPQGADSVGQASNFFRLLFWVIATGSEIQGISLGEQQALSTRILAGTLTKRFSVGNPFVRSEATRAAASSLPMVSPSTTASEIRSVAGLAASRYMNPTCRPKKNWLHRPRCIRTASSANCMHMDVVMNDAYQPSRSTQHSTVYRCLGVLENKQVSGPLHNANYSTVHSPRWPVATNACFKRVGTMAGRAHPSGSRWRSWEVATGGKEGKFVEQIGSQGDDDMSASTVAFTQ
jgi:hypothetical protein